MEQRFVEQQIPTKDLVAHYKLWHGLTSATTVSDYSLSDKTGTPTGTDIVSVYPGLSFNGTDDFVDVGNHAGAIKTVLFWVNATSIGGFDYPLDLNGTDYIVINSGDVGANGFAGSTIYVDGVQATTITAGSWHLIGLTIATAKTASDLDIGRVGGVGLFTGTIGDVMLFSAVLNDAEMKSIFEITRRRYSV